MGLGVGLLLVAVGAILTWAVTKDVSGVDIQVVGVILMIVGAVGILLDLLWWHSWRAGAVGYRRRAYVEGEPRPRGRGRRRTTYVEEDAGGPPPGPPAP
jgi:Domain of unknown function (DUF6458)